jgi:hypothetical protein
VYSRGGSYEYDGNAMEHRPYSANEVYSRGGSYEYDGNAMEHRPYSANEVYSRGGSYEYDGDAIEHRPYSANEVYSRGGSYEYDGNAMEHRPYSANKTAPKPKLHRRLSNYTNYFSESLRTVVKILDEAISPNQSPTKSIIVNHNSSESNDISAISFNSF